MTDPQRCPFCGVVGLVSRERSPAGKTKCGNCLTSLSHSQWPGAQAIPSDLFGLETTNHAFAVAHAGAEAHGVVMTPAQAIQAHLGGTQREVAERLGLTFQSWNRYLKGRACPSADVVQGWCKAVGVTLACDGSAWRVA